jgi:hypothetical protein
MSFSVCIGFPARSGPEARTATNAVIPAAAILATARPPAQHRMPRRIR